MKRAKRFFKTVLVSAAAALCACSTPDAADPETVLTPGYLQPYLEQGSGLFDSVGMTERPDVLASRLLEGRVGVFIDGVPFVLTAPRLFVESFQSVDDYAFKPWYATFIRYVKYAAFFLTLLLKPRFTK